MQRFDILMTTFNRLDYTKRTVASLISSGAVADCERFIIVDNRSTQMGFQDFLNDLYWYNEHTAAKVWLLRRGKNDGWGTAVNDGLGMSRAPFILVSNNDVEYSVDFHKKMFDSFEHQDNIGLLGVWRHTGHGFKKDGVMNDWVREMDNVPAVGWMMPKSAMEKVGLFPENGPCLTRGGNGEDTAYVMRMKQAGFIVGVPKEDVATHIDGY